MERCRLCEKECKSTNSLMKHVNAAHEEYDKKRYYNEFIRANEEGTCPCGKETTFRDVGRGYLKFCSHSCYARDKNTREKMSERAKGKKQSLETIQKRITNTDQAKKEEQRRLTCIARYGVENAISIPGSKDKVRATCIAKYGVRSAAQRSRSTHGKWKTVVIEGKKFRVQGYEDVFLERSLEFGFPQESLTQGKNNCPTIPWTDSNGIERVYFPDFFVRDRNLLIEIKSSWTFENNKESALAKLDAAKKLGYNTICIIFSSRNDKEPRIIT